MTLFKNTDGMTDEISTHTLTWSVTKVAVGSVIIEDISTHTLTWSVTKVPKLVINPSYISTHTLTWSVTLFRSSNSASGNHFNSHAHVERDVNHYNHPFIKYNFNSHAHVERDELCPMPSAIPSDFNSHAHVERDAQCLNKLNAKYISTHTLTWSVTRFIN